MKNTYFVTSIFMSMFVLFMGSCTRKCECPDPNVNMTSDYDIKKNIIQTNSTNFATGFESIFENSYLKTSMALDSTFHAELCQAIINPVRFFDDESGYFFVETYNAWMVAHATKPELIGTYRYNVQDLNGKYYVHDMLEAIKYKGYGFVDYYFEHPETGMDTRKLSFVKAIPNAEFFIGTGFYDFRDNYYLTKEDAALSLVQNVTKSMAEGLSGGFEMQTDSMGKVMLCRDFIDHIRFFDNQSGYFFIYDFNCVNVAHGTEKELEGQNLYNYQDSKGNYVVRGLVEVAKTSGFGYYEYYWNNPVTGKEEPKKSFVYKIPGIDYFIGSGVYFE